MTMKKNPFHTRTRFLNFKFDLRFNHPEVLEVDLRFGALVRRGDASGW